MVPIDGLLSGVFWLASALLPLYLSAFAHDDLKQAHLYGLNAIAAAATAGVVFAQIRLGLA